jgi:probable HAF family extracellular repeat protein/autotransporter-associated beta strand protein
MRGRPAWFAVVVLVVVSGSAPAQQPSYTLLDLGVLSGSDATVSGISSGGRVGIVNERATGLRSFVWQSGTALDIGTLGGTRTFAHGITFNTGSSATQVVGNSTLASGSTRAFLWTAGGTGGVAGNPEMRNLGTLGGAYSDALAVNATGRVTGFSENGSGRDRAFLWTSGTMSDLGAIIQSRIGLTWSYGYGINGLSRVVGYGYNDSFDAAVAWFYNGTTVRDLGDLGGGDAYPTAINDADQIVGYSATVDFFERAFVVTGTGVMRSLGTLGGQSSYALAVNNAGQVVGGSFVDPADSVYRAFVTVSGTMRDLNSYLDTSGQGWVLEEATGINSAGQIVGVAFAGGTTRAFLASPSAPLTWSISGTQPGGTGTWSGTASSWLSGTTRTTWTGTSKAVFAGSSATVTVSGTLGTSGGLEFKAGSSTLTGGTLTLLSSAFGTVPVISVSATSTASVATTLAGTAGLLKSGSGILVLRGTNTLTGPVTVQTGTLRLASTTALADGDVFMREGATLKVSSLLQPVIESLDLTDGGKIDVTDGTLTVGSGLTPVSTVAEILAGQGDGSWNGANGITSSAVAAAVAASVPRAIGWLDNGGGSITVAYSAPGDTNIDGSVDILDAANFFAGGKYDSGMVGSWSEGDFGYDGVVDILDAADFLSTGLYDTGAYVTFASMPVAAVPEPGAVAVLAAAATLAVTRLFATVAARGRAWRTRRPPRRRPGS